MNYIVAYSREGQHFSKMLFFTCTADDVEHAIRCFRKAIKTGKEPYIVRFVAFAS